MNDQGPKKIFFNKSTLLNLKAELLKKQEEVQEKKRLPQHKPENFKPQPAWSKIEDDKTIKKTFKDSLQAIDMEELEAFKKTKAALEKKAELYDHLANPVGNSKLSSGYLVDFNQKKQQDIPIKEHPDSNGSTDINCYNDDDDDSEWTEFVDCLGRTRKCLKTDLELFKAKDKELMRSSNANSAGDIDTKTDSEVPKKTEKPYLVEKTNSYLQTLREKWEQKERELMAKDQDIHYQDLLFDEARMHGVGYYAFSTDEKERHRQMEELLARREETLRAQAAAEATRREAEALTAARLQAARARQRLRAGLPPEDPQENQKDFNTCLLEFLNKHKEEAEARLKEEERKIKEEIEKERQKLREAYVREWDLGKEGVAEKVKKFKEMTQEEYVAQERAKRIDEFAPMQSTSTRESKYTFDVIGKKVQDQNCLNKTWEDVRPKMKTPPPPSISECEEERGLYFSTSKNKTRPVKYKNFVQTQEPTPIENELSDDETETVSRKPEKRKVSSSNVEIAPPPTYEYYGPIPNHSKSKKSFESDIREAYAQGAKSLKTKPSNRQLPPHYDFSLE